LKEKFSAHGEVGDVYIPRKPGSTEPKGYAFVRFLDKTQAEEAQRSLDGVEIEGREISIQEAKQRRPDNPRQFYNQRREERG
jgi:RNA recognition motif-containing protein